MVKSNIYEMLPYYVQLEDRKRGELVKHLCEQGVQPQVEAMKQAIGSRDVAFRADLITSNDFIEWVGGIFGLITYGEHWVGTGINPLWNPNRSRLLVQNIYRYWESKGRAGSFALGFDLWLREDYQNLNVGIKEEVPISATIDLDVSSLRLWDYYTPFGFNFLNPMAISKVMGVGDLYSLRQDYLGKEVVTIEKRGWEKRVRELDKVESETLSIEDNFEIKGFRIRENLSLEGGGYREFEEVIREEEVNQPTISKKQRSHLWENNIIRKISLERTLEEDISVQWNLLIKQAKELSLESTNLTKTPYYYWICRTIGEISINRNRVILTGVIGNDYVNIRPFLLGENFTLVLDFRNKKRYLQPVNYYWQGENENYGGIAEVVEDNEYVLNSNKLVVEFAYHSGEEEEIQSMGLFAEGRAASIEEVIFVDPLFTNICHNINFQFILSLELALNTVAIPITEISLTIENSEVWEDGQVPLTYTFTRNRTTTNNLVFFFAVSGTAVLGVDCDTSGTNFVEEGGLVIGSLVFAPEAYVATLNIYPIVNEFDSENKSVIITLLVPQDDSYTIANPNAVTGYIWNRDTGGSGSVFI